MRISGAARALAALAAAATVLTTAPAQAGPIHPAATVSPWAGAPTVGACSTMTPAQAAAHSDASTVVPCSQRHTAKVAGVVKLPDAMQWSTASNKALYKVVAAKCAPKVWKLLGRTHAVRDKTAYDWVWFVPTKADKASGARWLSCSVVFDHGSKLAPIPSQRTPLLPSGRLHDNIARCLTKSVLRTPCAATHAWRATGTFTLHVATRPGVKSLNKTSARKCLRHVNPHKYYRWTYSDAFVWKAGDHTVVCYTRMGA